MILGPDYFYRYLPRWVGERRWGWGIPLFVTNTQADQRFPGEVGGQRETG